MIKEYDDRVLQWIDKNKLVNSKGESFEWMEHPFLIDPMCDFHPRQGVNKCSQVGWSETSSLKTFYAAHELGWNIIYTLPTDRFIQNFVPPKVDSIINSNPVLAENIEGGVYLKKVKHLNSHRYIYYMGAFNPEAKNNRDQSSKGVAVSSDLNVHDEASRSDQFVISQMESRLANSKYKGIWKFDNPTYPNMGADSVYRLSDQRHWMIKCRHCGYWQYLDWFRLDKYEFKSGTNHCWIDTERKLFLCGKCQKDINNADRLKGKWIAKYPTITDYRGYWISHLDYINHDVESILREDDDQKKPKSQFFNMVLGKPYVGSDVKVSRENITALMDGNKNEKRNNYMGVDQGNTKWYVIGNDQGIFKVGHTEKWEEIEMLRNQYDAVMVGDQFPNQLYINAMAKKYPAKVWKSIYKPKADQTVLAQFGTKGDPYHVLVKRDQAFDELVNKIMLKDISIQMSYSDLEEFISHWENMVRVVEEDSEGNQRFKWVETGPDHYCHATLYWFIAKMKGQKFKLSNGKQQQQHIPKFLNANIRQF